MSTWDLQNVFSCMFSLLTGKKVKDNEIVGLYKEVYYAWWCTEAEREADSVAAQRSLTVEREAREKLAADLADQ